jgi:hypothetical protein
VIPAVKVSRRKDGLFSNTKCRARQGEKKIVLDKIGSFP